MTMLLFSVIWNALSGLGLPPFPTALLRTRSSMVSGTESLINLHRIKPSIGQHMSVIDILTFAFVKELHGFGRDGEKMSDILVSSEYLKHEPRPRCIHTQAYTVDVIGKRPSFILVDRVLGVGSSCPFYRNPSLARLEPIPVSTRNHCNMCWLTLAELWLVVTGNEAVPNLPSQPYPKSLC